MRYPPEARRRLEEAGVRYAGWLPNHRVPEVFGLEICVGLGLEDLHAEAFAAAGRASRDRSAPGGGGELTMAAHGLESP